MFRLNLLSGRISSPVDVPDHGDSPAEPPKPVPGAERQGRARHVILGLGLTLAALPLVAPKPALAWWSGGGWVGGPAYVAPRFAYAPPPVYYAPPPVVYAPPIARWVPGHYNWRGFWIPGHWVG